MATPNSAFDLAQLQSRLQTPDGPAIWRSLEELAGAPEFSEALQREFPSLAERWANSVTRRDVLRVMGASLGLLGLTGCFYKKPQGVIVPYPKAPDEIVPGRPLFFATAMSFDGYARGVLALSEEGRPIKIEGNPDHPASLGASDVFMQASLLDLYDPDRAKTVMSAGRVAQWNQFYEALRQRLEHKRGNGNGLALLCGAVTSPTLTAQLDELNRLYPGMTRYEHDPIRRPGSMVAGAFATPLQTLYDFSDAAVIVSLGSDFLYDEPDSLRAARQFSDGRRVRKDRLTSSRLYVIESTLTVTGSMADNRLPLLPSQIEQAARLLAQKLGAEFPAAAPQNALTANASRWIEAVAADVLHPEGGKPALLVAGENQPPVVHALAYLMNQKLGNIGKSVTFIDPVAMQGGRPLKDLAADLASKKIDTLLILGGNPAYDAPADLNFAQALEAMSSRVENGQLVNFTAHLSSHYDETSFRAQWHLPRSHYLETWGDLRSFDGTASIVQPLIAPLYQSKSEWELLEMMLGRPDRTGIEVVRGFWSTQIKEDFEKQWMAALQKGVVDGTTFPTRQPPALAKGALASPPQPTQGIEVLFHPDPNIRAGAYSNNAWLQELPKPFTKLTWDNAVVIGLEMASRLGGAKGMLQDGDVVRIHYRGRQLEAPVILLPGQPDGMITLPLGYGRSAGGQVLRDDNGPRGFNAFSLRTDAAPWADGGASVQRTDRFQLLVVTRNHNAMDAAAGMPGIAPSLKPEVIARPGDTELDLEVQNRKIVRTVTLRQLQADPDAVKKLDPQDKKPLLSLYPAAWNYEQGLQWGMSIDMTACTGCNACVIACQAENNIPVVGKEEVSRQREMHWIRVDNYFSGPLESPSIYHQPVPCQHCENAPCEYVCPVGATTHSDEGINEMTYNRCIGTRYCSNNCPYKVRRFNFFLYSDYTEPSLKLMRNPDVTVRSRGVMEKCTYCIQRIDRTRIEMEKQVLDLTERSRVATDEQEKQRLLQQAESQGRAVVRALQTACQQACPTQAIIFGDIRDAGGAVARLKKEPTNYGLLTELTTKPRTTYLAKVTHPNPALEPEVAS